MGFLPDILRNSYGIVLAQVILLAASPVLSRLYSPEAFGVFALFFAVVSLVSVAATGRYEMAISLPKEDGQARALLRLSTILSLITGLIAFLALSQRQWLPEQFVNDYLPPSSAWMLAISIVLAAFLLIVHYWLVRGSAFTSISNSRIVQSLVFAGTGVGFAIVGVGADGLIWAFVLGQLSRLLTMYVRATGMMDPAASLKLAAKRYRDFPLFNAPAALLTAFRAQLPVFVFSSTFTSGQTGQYEMVNRAIGTPMSFVALAIGDVLHQRMSTARHEARSLFPIVKLFAMALSAIALPPVIIVMIFGPPLFGFVFGAEWQEAGRYAQILAPAFFVRFVMTPLSRALIVSENVRVNSMWQVMSTITFAIACLMGIRYGVGGLLIAISIHEVMAYLLYGWLIVRCTRTTEDR
ncbi:MAG: oligosaccharide flippase family protein [Pseudomonadota bacterium]